LKSSSFRSAFVAVFSFVFICQSGFGQATGTISGTVTDPSGGVVSGAKVKVTAPATGASRETTTDSSGRYIVPLLGVGNYTVRADAPGFATEEVKDVVLQTNEQRELDLT
jgi:hypothetical protein